MADPCSFSSFTKCVTIHLNLSLHVDFDRRVIRGRVALTMEALQDRLSSLVRLPAPGAPLPLSLQANGLLPQPSPSAPA